MVVFEDSECPEFLWTHGPSRFVDAATGEAILEVEVVEAGRADRPPLPFDP